MAYTLYFECDQPKIAKVRCYDMSFGARTLSSGKLNPVIAWRREALTGQASGGEEHSPITVTKDY